LPANREGSVDFPIGHTDDDSVDYQHLHSPQSALSVNSLDAARSPKNSVSLTPMCDESSDHRVEIDMIVKPSATLMSRPKSQGRSGKHSKPSTTGRRRPDSFVAVSSDMESTASECDSRPESPMSSVMSPEELRERDLRAFHEVTGARAPGYAVPFGRSDTTVDSSDNESRACRRKQTRSDRTRSSTPASRSESDVDGDVLTSTPADDRGLGNGGRGSRIKSSRRWQEDGLPRPSDVPDASPLRSQPTRQQTTGSSIVLGPALPGRHGSDAAEPGFGKVRVSRQVFASRHALAGARK
jgi:hypothetical protein